MSEKDIVRSVIDFAFLIKGQLKSDETSLLRSILNVVIMEAEDVIYDLSNSDDINEIIIEENAHKIEKRA
jgi:hypothetical protein